MNEKKLSALILGGGKGTRMGGKNKAKLLYKGEPFITHIERALAFLPEGFYAGPAGSSAFPSIPEPYPGAGPMSGILAGLYASGYDGVAVLPCDMPTVKESLVHYLIERADAPIAIAKTSDGRLHPVCGVYLKSCIPTMETLLKSGSRRMMLLFEQMNGQAIDLTGTPFDRMITNINTKEDLLKLEESQ